MGFKDRIQPHIQEIIEEAPNVTIRNEVVEAIAWSFKWMLWREQQVPVPPDTFANRAQFAKVMASNWLGSQLIEWLATYRRRGDDEATEID